MPIVTGLWYTHDSGTVIYPYFGTYNINAHNNGTCDMPFNNGTIVYIPIVTGLIVCP